MKLNRSIRMKNQAETAVPQTMERCAEDINEIGRLTREVLRLQTAMNDDIAALTDSYVGLFEPHKKRIDELQKGVQSFCEAHRDLLTDGGKVKTGRFITGEVQWRQRPPSVSVRGVQAVIETLKRLGLGRFVRSKEELNKEAILNEPAEVIGVAGITIVTGVEDFVITPFEQETA